MGMRGVDATQCMSCRRSSLAVLTLLGATLVPASAARAGLPAYVVDAADSAVLRIDSVTGAAQVISHDGLLSHPTGIAIEADGDLVVTDSTAPRVVRIDHRTGAQALVSSAAELGEPTDIAVAPGGTLMVADNGATTAFLFGAVLAVDPATGTASVVSPDGSFSEPTGVTVGGDGGTLVADADGPTSSGGVIAVAPGTGAQSVAAQGGGLADPTDVAVDGAGRYLITDANGSLPGLVLRGSGGPPSVVASGDRLVDPRSVALERAGTALVADPGAGQLIRIEPDTGDQTLVAGALNQPMAVAVPRDGDGDGIAEVDDTCPGLADPAQTDTDLDGHGDACDADDDNDGVRDLDETARGTDPLKPDTDGDAAGDGADDCPATFDVAQVDSDGDGLGDACDPAPLTGAPASGTAAAQPTPAFTPRLTTALSEPQPQPVLQRAVGVSRASGTVTIRKPGQDRDVPVTGGAIPVGAVVDTTAGAITLTTAMPDGSVQSARFSGGRFSVAQRSDGSTDLRLRGTPVCAAKRTAYAASRGKGKRRVPVPRLWGDGHGRFRTHGRNAVATVRGTKWLVEDRCDGTLVRVARGVVSVHDDRTGRNRLLRKGEHHLARARR